MRIYAHRGASGEFAEGSQAAYLAAIEQGSDGFECDVRLTKDKQIICYHDKDAKRLSNLDLKIADTNYDQLKRAINPLKLEQLLDLAIKSKKDLEKILRPIGLRARWFENTATWINAVTDALALPESQWPPVRTDSDSLPPIKIWRERFPERYAPLTHAKANIQLKANELVIPFENLITPEYVRRICWNSPKSGVAAALADLGARQWQIEIVAPILETALLETEPLAIAESEPDSEAQVPEQV